MQRAFLRFLFIALLALGMSFVAQAHEGHDHSHWSSMFIHALLLLSMAASGLAIVFAIYRAISRWLPAGK
ncbi:MAG: hypothetical protein VYD53_03580 [Pseudomonadota bacterium]|nr:hypothetical protein [Pseudomonadota bacterium]